MSTAQDVLDHVRYAINPKADVFGVLNEAVRAVAKRLYVLESGILQKELSVSIWQSDSLTASDIAFVDSDPDTITGVAGAFVTSGFVAGMHITTDSSNNAGPYELDTVAAGTLTLISTDSLTAEVAGTEFTITSDASYGDLPSDFWGLIEYPYLSGQTWHLDPLPNQKVKHTYTGAGIPLYYLIKGSRFEVIPSTGADYTVVGDYFAKPTEITAVTTTMPYDELFDDVIAEYMKVHFSQAGRGGTILMPTYLRDEIDNVVSKREKKAPYHQSGGVNWGGYL